MFAILKITMISLLTLLFLFIGGWIASSIIKEEYRFNLIDW